MPTYKYPRPSVTVDLVIFGFNPNANGLSVLLIKRKDPPFKSSVALPGGFVQMGETLEKAAFRELKEETAIVPSYLEQLYTFGEPNRDPRGRVISVAYYALVPTADHLAKAGSDAMDASWHSVKSALKQGNLAFDHQEILEMAISRLKAKIRYAPIGFDLLPTQFSLGDLQNLYESILGRVIDRRNFSKKILSMNILKRVDEKKKDGPGRPAIIYEFDRKNYDYLISQGWTFEI